MRGRTHTIYTSSQPGCQNTKCGTVIRARPRYMSEHASTLITTNYKHMVGGTDFGGAVSEMVMLINRNKVSSLFVMR